MKIRLRHDRSGQNVIEYLLVSVGVLIVMIYFLNAKGGPMKGAMENIFNDTVNDIQNLGAEIKY